MHGAGGVNTPDAVASATSTVCVKDTACSALTGASAYYAARISSRETKLLHKKVRMRHLCRAMYIGAAVMAGSVCAQVYYVAPDGNDTNMGSQATPFLTVQHAYGVALSSAAPALITLAPGTYCASNPVVVAGAQVLLQGAGVGQSVIADAVVVTGDTRLADLTCAAAFSNAASACLVHNVKLGLTPSGAGCLYGLWYNADDYAQVSSLTEPHDGFDAVNALWVSNHVRQAALLRSGGAMSGVL